MEATAPVIALQAVESSKIHSIGHDAESNTLAIRFKSKDGAPTSLYHYANVSADDFAALTCAESIGSHFHKHIKPHADKYPYVKVEAAPAA